MCGQGGTWHTHFYVARSKVARLEGALRRLIWGSSTDQRLTESMVDILSSRPGQMMSGTSAPFSTLLPGTQEAPWTWVPFWRKWVGETLTFLGSGSRYPEKWPSQGRISLQPSPTPSHDRKSAKTFPQVSSPACSLQQFFFKNKST